MAWRNFCPGTVRFFSLPAQHRIGLLCSWSWQRVCVFVFFWTIYEWRRVSSLFSNFVLKYYVLWMSHPRHVSSVDSRIWIQEKGLPLCFRDQPLCLCVKVFQSKDLAAFRATCSSPRLQAFSQKKKKSKAPSLVSLVCSSYDVISSRLISTITVNVLAANGTVGSPDLARGWMAILEIVSKIFPARIEN
jgi:hypothetical protein